jgi:tetratricopeptide (TPR) repeat protein
MHIILGQQDPASPHNDIALEYTDRSLAISPTFVRAYYEVAQAYLNKRDLAKAYEWFAKAQQLNADVGITYWYMAIVRAQAGDLKGAAELVNERPRADTCCRREIPRRLSASTCSWGTLPPP